jgi:hypothetical protein
MAPLIFSRLALGVKKIGDRRAAHHDRFFQNGTERTVQRFGLFSRQVRSQARGMNLCPPQTLVRINIPDAAQHALIEQQRLHSRPPRPYARDKFLRAHFERIGPEAAQFLFERISGEIRHSPKTPRIRVTQLAPVIEQETRVRMLRARLRSGMRRDVSRHPEMYKQGFRSFLAVRSAVPCKAAGPNCRWRHEPQQHEFSVSLDGCDLSSGQVLLQRDRIINEIRFPQRYRQNAPAQNSLA